MYTWAIRSHELYNSLGAGPTVVFVYNENLELLEILIRYNTIISKWIFIMCLANSVVSFASRIVYNIQSCYSLHLKL